MIFLGIKCGLKDCGIDSFDDNQWWDLFTFGLIWLVWLKNDSLLNREMSDICIVYHYIYCGGLIRAAPIYLGYIFFLAHEDEI